MMRDNNDNGARQIAVGAGVLAALALLVCTSLAGWRHVPGLAGEWLGTVVGVMSTPFLLEASFFLLGLAVVLAINGWHQQRGGDEWVDLDMTRFLPCVSHGRFGSIDRMSDELVAMNMAHFVKMAYGDVPWLKGLASDFFRETRALQPQWMALIEAGNFTELRVELHRCKGGASLFGFERIVALLGICESPQEIEIRGFNMTALEQELDAAEAALAAMIEPVP
jgi:hypothetical protein